MQNGIRRKCLRNIFVVVFLFCFVIFLYPDEDIIKNPMTSGLKVTSTFCDSRGDHFHTGIDIVNKDKKVYSLMKSDLIFHNSKRKGSINYGYGDFLILENTSDGLRFSFSHLKENSYNSEKKKYMQFDEVAEMGNTGHSTGVHLHLEIEDTKNGALINPLELMEVDDTLKPRIMDVYFIDANDNKISLYEGNSSIKRGGKLFVKCMDKIDGSIYSLIPNRIDLIIDGKEKASLNFNKLVKQKGRFLTDDGRGFEDIYLNDKADDFFIMDFSSLPGIIGFKLLVEDHGGNRTEYRRALKILLPDKKVEENEEEKDQS